MEDGEEVGSVAFDDVAPTRAEAAGKDAVDLAGVAGLAADDLATAGFFAAGLAGADFAGDCVADLAVAAFAADVVAGLAVAALDDDFAAGEAAGLAADLALVAGEADDLDAAGADLLAALVAAGFAAAVLVALVLAAVVLAALATGLAGVFTGCLAAGRADGLGDEDELDEMEAAASFSICRVSKSTLLCRCLTSSRLGAPLGEAGLFRRSSNALPKSADLPDGRSLPPPARNTGDGGLGALPTAALVCFSAFSPSFISALNALLLSLAALA